MTTSCPICGAAARLFLRRDAVAVHQNLLVDTPDAARRLSAGTLELHACPACEFVFNAAFDPARLQYGAVYDNTQTASPTFVRYVDELADRLAVFAASSGSRIVEVGCGKGGFLCAVAMRNSRTTGIGFDPSYTGPDVALDGRVRFERRFYDATCAVPDADLVICRHVIEHVSDPVELLRAIRDTLTIGRARVFFETPCVEWILSNQVVWDFFYEHCSYFTARALARAFETAGFAVDGMSHVFGGQYLWAEAHPITKGLPVTRGSANVAALAETFAAHERTLISRLRDDLLSLRVRGPVAIWGAGAKGVTLASLVDPDCRLVACVVDLNPNKQGRYLPGTGHRIVHPRTLGELGVRSAVLTNPNYLQESAALLDELGLDVELVDLMRTEVDADTY